MLNMFMLLFEGNLIYNTNLTMQFINLLDMYLWCFLEPLADGLHLKNNF